MRGWKMKCKEKGCKKLIREDQNKSGFCAYHYRVNWAKKKIKNESTINNNSKI